MYIVECKKETNVGAGLNLEYLSAINSSVYDKSRFQKRSIISHVERARASGLG